MDQQAFSACSSHLEEQAPVTVKDVYIELPHRNFTLNPQEGDIITCSKGTYKVGSLLGSGGYAIVNQAVSTTGLAVALKTAKTIARDHVVTKAAFTEEINALNAVMEEKQLNIVEILDVSLSKCCLVMEFCNLGSLEELVSGPRHYNWGRDEAGAFTVLRGLLHDLQYLQRIKIIHRNLSCTNILLNGELRNANFVAKIADFGIAHVIKEDGYLGIVYYMLCGDSSIARFSASYKDEALINLIGLAYLVSRYPHVSVMKEIVRRTIVFDPRNRWSLHNMLELVMVRGYYEETNKARVLRNPRPRFVVCQTRVAYTIIPPNFSKKPE